MSIPAPVWYDGKNPRQGEEAAAVNRFAQLDAYMSDPAVSGAVILSRSDWQGTQPGAVPVIPGGAVGGHVLQGKAHRHILMLPRRQQPGLAKAGQRGFKSDPTFPNQDDGSGRFLYENAFTTLVSSGVLVTRTVSRISSAATAKERSSWRKLV